MIYNAGFADTNVPQWLSQEDMDGLIQYTVDLDMASQLLTEAGWSKDGDTWTTPDR